MEGRRFDVAIVGAGVIGMSVAYHLVKSGCSNVIVIEKDTVGSGTTAKSLGGFRHQYSTRLNIQFSNESIRFLRDFSSIFGIDISIRNDGYIFLATSEEQMQSLESQAAMQKSLGVETIIVDPTEIGRMFPYLDLCGIVGGSYGPTDGHADTSAVLQGYAREARKGGVVVSENTKVEGFDHEAGTGKINSIKTSRGAIKADWVLLAAGPHTGELGRRLLGVNIPVNPYSRTILVTNKFDQMPNQIPQIFDLGTTLGIGRSGFAGIHLGLRRMQPMRSNFEIVEDPTYAEKVVAEAVRRMPSLKNASIAFTFSGLYEQTPDSNPIIGRVGENVYVASGFSGHGFMHSPAAGRVASELILHGKCEGYDLSEFSPERFSERDEESARERLAI